MAQLEDRLKTHGRQAGGLDHTHIPTAALDMQDLNLIAEQVHASLEVMERDSKKMRGERPFVFTNLYDGVGLEEIIRFILDKGMLDERRPRAAVTH